MTKSQLKEVIEVLADIADGWNDAVEDEDRGRGDKSICLTVYEDGSGRVGQRSCLGEVQDVYDFNSLDELATIIEEEGMEITPEEGEAQDV